MLFSISFPYKRGAVYSSVTLQAGQFWYAFIFPPFYIHCISEWFILTEDNVLKHFTYQYLTPEILQWTKTISSVLIWQISEKHKLTSHDIHQFICAGVNPHVGKIHIHFTLCHHYFDREWECGILKHLSSEDVTIKIILYVLPHSFALALQIVYY